MRPVRRWQDEASRPCSAASVRKEFIEALPGRHHRAEQADGRQAAGIQPSHEAAMERDLIGTREIGGVDRLWLAVQD